MARIPYPPLRSGTPDERQLSNWLVRAHERLVTEIPAILTGTLTWNPPLALDGANTSVTVPVDGASVGQPALAAFSSVLPAGAMLSAVVTAQNTVRVTLHNETGASLDLSSGTLRVVVLSY